jgi:hypothetical protein
MTPTFTPDGKKPPAPPREPAIGRLWRAAGGYYVHSVPEGTTTAACGFTPGVNARQHHMKDRSGWYQAPRYCPEISCPKCRKAVGLPPKTGDQIRLDYFARQAEADVPTGSLE